MMCSKNVGIIGASGWLGGHLAPALRQAGWNVTGFSRSERPDDGDVQWRRWSGEGPVDLTGLDAVINLAGEAIDQRWTKARKIAFRKSRVDLTEDLVKSISESEVKVLLNGSATGFYGDRGDDALSESEAVGEGYLAGLCDDWEAAAEIDGLRVCLLRTGVVLGDGGRAWEKMNKIFRLGIGGKLGSGKQWMPWIHLSDEINAIIHCLEHDLSGPVNLVAPESARNSEFTKAVGRVLNRPTFFAAPAFMLKLALGDFAEEGLLASTRAVPEKLLQSGFKFAHPEIEGAMRECVGS